MSASWRVLDFLDYEGVIGGARGGLEVDGRRIPLDDVGSILLGPGCRWGFGLPAHAVQYDVAVLVCDWRRVPIAVLSGWSTNTRVNTRHRAQAALSLPRQKAAWKSLVRSKVSHQARSLHACGDEAGFRRLLTLASGVRSGDPANIEAQAAAYYWPRLMGDLSGGRDSSSTDIFNGCLNYGYTVLRGLVIREIVAHGLWPTLGVFHRHRGNSFALADDLIEPFRPVVDVVARELCTAGSEGIGREERAALVAVSSAVYSSDGSSVATAVSRLCDSYASYVLGESPRLVVPAWNAAADG